MTMAQNVARIASAKESIRQAIIAKGVDVDQAALIGTYADKIAEISQDTPNIITFERYTERINTKKKSINGSGWQSIVSTNVFIEDVLPIDSRLHNTALLLTTQFKADANITFTADNLRVIIDLEWLDSNNNIVKTDANLETNFKMARKIDNVDIYDTVTRTLKQGYFYSAMFGLRIHDIPGWSGVPAGATQLKLKSLKTELIYNQPLYLESGAGTMCSVLSNEGHEDPPTPPSPTPEIYKIYVVIGGTEYQVSDTRQNNDSQNALVLFSGNEKSTYYFAGSPISLSDPGPPPTSGFGQSEIELTTSDIMNGVCFAGGSIIIKLNETKVSTLTMTNYVNNVIVDKVNKKILIQN